LGVEVIQEGLFTISRAVEVDVSISQRATGDTIPANTNGSDWTIGVEDFEKVSLRNITYKKKEKKKKRGRNEY
jgi:hypothetical protein